MGGEGATGQGWGLLGTMDLSEIDFSAIDDLSSLYNVKYDESVHMQALTDLHLENITGIDAALVGEFDLLWNEKSTLDNVYVTPDVYDQLYTPVLAAWDAQEGNTVHLVPEPGSLLLVLTGLLAMGLFRLRGKN